MGPPLARAGLRVRDRPRASPSTTTTPTTRCARSTVAPAARPRASPRSSRPAPYGLPDLAREWWSDLRFYDSRARPGSATAVPRGCSARTPAGAGRLRDRLAVGGERHVDVAPRRVRVRAHLVGRRDELPRRLGVLRRPAGVTSSSTASLKPRSSVGSRLTRLSIETSSTSARSRRATAMIAPSKQAAKPTANSCSGFVPPPSPPSSVGRAQLDVEHAVRASAPWPLSPAAGDSRLRRVENLCHGQPSCRGNPWRMPPAGIARHPSL